MENKHKAAQRKKTGRIWRLQANKVVACRMVETQDTNSVHKILPLKIDSTSSPRLRRTGLIHLDFNIGGLLGHQTIFTALANFEQIYTNFQIQGSMVQVPYACT
jgi:hypothetical protein